LNQLAPDKGSPQSASFTENVDRAIYRKLGIQLRLDRFGASRSRAISISIVFRSGGAGPAFMRDMI
jgi:hypothetical protein